MRGEAEGRRVILRLSRMRGWGVTMEDGCVHSLPCRLSSRQACDVHLARL